MSINASIIEAVARIEIARPKRKNAPTAAMYQQMADAIVPAEANTAARATISAVITG